MLLGRLGRDQLSYCLLRSALANPAVECLAFYHDAGPTHLTPPLAAMEMAESFGFRGVAVATDLATAAALLRSPGPRARLFYVWDLEWMRSARPHGELAAIYRSPRLELVARSEPHRHAIEDAWNRPVRAVVPDCDVAALSALA